MELVKYEAARRALQIATTVNEVKSIKDKAEAVRVYAKQAGDVEMQNWAVELKLRAARRAGEVLALMKEKGQLAEGARPANCRDMTTVEELGLSRDQSSEWQKLAAIPEKIFDRVISGAKELSVELTSARVWRALFPPSRSKTVAGPEILYYETRYLKMLYLALEIYGALPKAQRIKEFTEHSGRIVKELE
jgi:hypothetical protein